MSTDNREYVCSNVEKMIEHCENVAYMRHKIHNKKEFLSDVMSHYAFTNALAQIGEHAKRIDIWLENHYQYDWPGCIRFRDLVGHRYSTVDYEFVWGIVNNDVPELLSLLLKIRNDIPRMPDYEFGVITNRLSSNDLKPKKRFWSRN